jgi:ABC-type multidrug transport system fused ATPase/permease subunit
VAVVGQSGAGKSTLAALVARFYDPSSGRVLIDGRDARDYSRPWLRAQVGFLLQDTVLFTGTVAENIAYAVDATRAQVVAAARAAGAHDFVTALPEGYDTPLGPRGVGLSGGQRQRIGIARVLLRNPPLLVLDEPTTGLDAATEAALLDELEALMAGRTTVVITHSLTLARRTGRVLVLDAGRLVEDGSPAELLARGGQFARLCAHGRVLEAIA